MYLKNKADYNRENFSLALTNAVKYSREKPLSTIGTKICRNLAPLAVLNL